MVLDLGDTKEPKGMQCPHCQVTLKMSAREGIEIDYCPQCRGVWLDRGELDKIIERSVGDAPQPQRQQAQAPRKTRERDYDDDDDDYDYKRRKPQKRRKSWIADIFDELT